MNVYITVGAPGSGKSTWGRQFVKDNPSVVRICPDEFRAKFGTGEGDQSVSYQAFQATFESMKNALKEGKDVIIDATNMYRKRRKEFLDIAKMWNAHTIAVVFELDKQTLLDRNVQRGKEGGRVVPEDVIDMMISKYQRPDSIEFNEVMIK